MATITIDGTKHKVLDNLGHQGGYLAKEVETDNGPRIVVKDAGVWRFWSVEDRLGE